MKIKRFRVSGYKNLDDVTIDFLNLTTIIGKNNIGKTNILKALDLFFNWTISKEYKEVSNSGGGSATNMSATLKDLRLFKDQKIGNIELEAELEIDDKDLKRIVNLGSEANLDSENHRLLKELYFANGNLFEIKKLISVDSNKKSEWKLKELLIGGNALFKDKSYSSRDYVNLTELILQWLNRQFYLIPTRRGIELEPMLGNSPNPNGQYIPSAFLRDEKDRSLGRLDRFNYTNQDIQKLFPEFKKVSSVTEGGMDHVDMSFDECPSSCVGSGIIQNLVILFHLNSQENQIFAIEEPEISLHSSQQRQFLDFLRKSAKIKQIIITTHSPIFASLSEGTTLYLIKRNEHNIIETHKIEKKEDHTHIRQEIGIKNSDIYYHDKIILVEGETEELALPIIAEYCGIHSDDVGIKFINIKGKDKLDKIKEFLRYIKNYDTEIYLILDKDDSVEEYVNGLIREEILDKNKYHIWSNGDFEDCFNTQQLYKAMQNIKPSFNISITSLQEKRDASRNKISKVLALLLFENDLGELNKPRLGEELALLFKEENIDSRVKTEPETILIKWFGKSI